MDGTFLTDAKTFDTDRFERILPRLQAHGIYFVVASGNTYTKLTDYMKGFENRGIIYIAENGAYLADDSGELAVHPFKEADVPHVYEVLDTLPQIGVILCTTEGIFIPHNRQGAVTSIVQDYFAAQGQPVPQGLDPYSFVLMFCPAYAQVLATNKRIAMRLLDSCFISLDYILFSVFFCLILQSLLFIPAHSIVRR